MLAKSISGAAAAVQPAFIEDVFSTYLYTGNGSTQTITNGIDLSGKGGLVWIKSRTEGGTNYTGYPTFFDTGRGATQGLFSSSTVGQSAYTTALTSFNSSGFSLGDRDFSNYSGHSFTSWTFRKQAKFFDVVTYTGNGASSQAISHALGSTPGCVIVKRTDSTSFWLVWHRGFSSPDVSYGYLNSTDPFQADSPNNNWAAAPTSTTFTPASNYNANGATYVAYLFAHDAGGFGLTGTDNVISCGSFTHNNTIDQEINLGWETQFVILKPTSSAVGWSMADTMRGMPTGANAQLLQPNTSGAEFAGQQAYPTAVGFKVRAGAYLNGTTVAYVAIRRGPMRVPTSGTSVFYPQSVSQTDTPDSTGVPFAPDLVSTFSRNGSERSASFNVFQVADRLRGLGTPNNSYSSSQEGPSLVTSSTGSEISATIPNGQSYIQIKADGRNITRGGGWNSSSYGNWIYYFMSRAPGFFDVVCYTGTGVARTVNHNLGVVPELMIVKGRSAGGLSWYTYVANEGASRRGFLNFDFAWGGPDNSIWNGTTPTASVFSLGADANINGNSTTFVAYLFATCPGVSKVGSYTGNGTTKQIDCGFTSGARFVLIKRTDSTGDWYVWDTARGIVAGNDPYLLLNSTDAEVTNTDYIDTYSAGFEISSTAPAAINANGGTFIFLAIA